MLKQKYLKIFTSVAVLLAISGSAAFAAQADSDAPPSISTGSGSQAGNSDAPPSITVGNGSQTGSNDLPPSINITTGSCTENATAENNSKLCQNGSYLTCDAGKEGIKSKDGQKECKSGKWLSVSNPPPPGGNPDPPPPPPDSGSTLKITKADVYPKGFNPTVTDSRITYAINKEAIIEIKISDMNDLVVTRIIENKKVSAGEYFVNWKGTANNEQSGPILPPGTYVYKILAKDPKSGEIKDTAKGEISLIYATLLTGNFQDIVGFQPPVETDPLQNIATQTLNNSSSGTTAQTGPGILIYFVFPLAGLLIFFKKKSWMK